MTQPEEIFCWSEGNKIEKFGIFRVNLPNPNQRLLTRPRPSNKKLTQPDPGQKFLTQSHHYLALIHKLQNDFYLW